MSIKALPKGAIYFDPTLNAILMADGSLSAYNTHNMTMLWPTYNGLDMSDQTSLRLIPAMHDRQTDIIEYYDPNLCKTITMNLKTGNVINPNSQSQQNWGWVSKDEAKKTNCVPFKVGSVLFHKTTRTKWVFSEMDKIADCPILRSFEDKSATKVLYKKDYEEFEEIFF